MKEGRIHKLKGDNFQLEITLFHNTLTFQMECSIIHSQAQLYCQDFMFSDLPPPIHTSFKGIQQFYQSFQVSKKFQIQVGKIIILIAKDYSRTIPVEIPLKKVNKKQVLSPENLKREVEELKEELKNIKKVVFDLLPLKVDSKITTLKNQLTQNFISQQQKGMSVFSQKVLKIEEEISSIKQMLNFQGEVKEEVQETQISEMQKYKKEMAQWKIELEIKKKELQQKEKVSYENGQYQGQWKDKKKHGFGIVTFSNGDKYEGEWSEGKHHGKGVYFYQNGDKYEGLYEGGRREGRGIYFWNSGNRLEGLYKDGKSHGQAIMYFAKGGKEERFYQNGEFIKPQI